MHGAKLGPIIKPMANMNTTNDNGQKIHNTSLAAIACFGGARVVIATFPGCPLVCTQVTTKGGRTKGFELSVDGRLVAVMGARATYDHLEAACRAYLASVAS